MSEEYPSVELCRWWMRNHTSMPADWRSVQAAYDRAHGLTGKQEGKKE